MHALWRILLFCLSCNWYTATSASLLAAALATWVVVSIVIIALLIKSRSRAQGENQMELTEQPAAMLTRKEIDTSQNIAYVATKEKRISENVVSTIQDASDSNVIYDTIDTEI